MLSWSFWESGLNCLYCTFVNTTWMHVVYSHFNQDNPNYVDYLSPTVWCVFCGTTVHFYVNFFFLLLLLFWKKSDLFEPAAFIASTTCCHSNTFLAFVMPTLCPQTASLFLAQHPQHEMWLYCMCFFIFYYFISVSVRHDHLSHSQYGRILSRRVPPIIIRHIWALHGTCKGAPHFNLIMIHIRVINQKYMKYIFCTSTFCVSSVDNHLTWILHVVLLMRPQVSYWQAILIWPQTTTEKLNCCCWCPAPLWLFGFQDTNQSLLPYLGIQVRWWNQQKYLDTPFFLPTTPAHTLAVIRERIHRIPPEKPPPSMYVVLLQ